MSDVLELAAAEARSETRFVELSGKIDRVIDSIDSFRSTLTVELSSVKSELSAVKFDNSYTRRTIVISVAASLLAAIAALWVTQRNMLVAFTAGIALRTEIK